MGPGADGSMTTPATPRICVTVGGATMAELCRARDEVRDADLVELRLDAVRDPDPGSGAGGPAPSRHRHVPPNLGRRLLQRLGRRAPDAAAARLGPRGRVRGRRARGTVRAPVPDEHTGTACCSLAPRLCRCAAGSRRPCGGHARDARGGHQGRRGNGPIDRCARDLRPAAHPARAQVRRDWHWGRPASPHGCSPRVWGRAGRTPATGGRRARSRSLSFATPTACTRSAAARPSMA